MSGEAVTSMYYDSLRIIYHDFSKYFEMIC